MGQGQSGQARYYSTTELALVSEDDEDETIKLFQITPYVNDFQTLNNPGSWQPLGASKN